MAPAAILVHAIPQVERHLTVVRIIAVVTVLGGLVRLLSILLVGMPESRALIAMAIELSFGAAILFVQHFVAPARSSV